MYAIRSYYGIQFIIEPYIRFKGQVGEQATMFFYDPAGNALEFKAFKDLGRITSYNVCYTKLLRGKGGFGTRGKSYDKDIIYTVVTRLELAKLQTEIDKIDKTAFVIMGIVKDLKGGMIKRKPLK